MTITPLFPKPYITILKSHKNTQFAVDGIISVKI